MSKKVRTTAVGPQDELPCRESNIIEAKQTNITTLQIWYVEEINSTVK
jgi:hypothetical protein